MRQYYIFISFFLFSFSVLSQVGIGTTTPDGSAMLEVSSSTDGTNYKGFMPPRVPSITERDAIPVTSSSIGLLVFVQSTNCLQVWNGTNWEDVHCIATATANVWINEFHYDNTGNPDTGEFVEIAGDAGTNLNGYSLLFTNGNGGNVYQSISLSGTIPDDGSGFGALSFAASFAIQNGGVDGDGIALISSSNTVIQNLSYEGSYVINEPGNILNGLTTDDVTISEPGTTAVGFSLQLQGTGNVLTDFVWAGPIDDTPGTVNTGQTFN